MDSQRLQVCVEGVFSYCVNNIRLLDRHEEITVKLFWEEHDLKVFIQHCGPRGEWDESLRDQSCPIRRTSFTAMGLFIARELLHSLNYESLFDVVQGRINNSYELVYRMQWAAEAGENDSDIVSNEDVDELLEYINT